MENFEDKILRFYNERYTVKDISRLDDYALNLDFPIDVEDDLEENQVSCRNSKVYIGVLKDEFENSQEKIEEFFEHYFTNLSYEHCNNAHNWMSYKDIIDLSIKVREFVGKRNPRELLEMGKYAAKHQSLGAGLDALSKLVTVKKIYSDSPKYVRNFNNGEFMQTVYNTNGTYVVHNKFATYLDPIKIIDQNYWTLGIFLGIPALKGLPFGEGKIDYSEFDIEQLLKREYSYLDVPDFRTSIGQDNFNAKRFLVNGKEYAREMILLKERFEKRKSSKKNDFIYDSYKPQPYRFDDFEEKELSSLLDKKKATRVMVVTRPLLIDNDLVLEEGEIYNAPYTRFTIQYKDRNPVLSLLNGLTSFRKNMYITRSAMENEIKKAKEEAMRANREAATARANEVLANESRLESERKSNIFRVYVRPSLVDRVDQGENPTEDDLKIIDSSILFSDIRDFTNLSELMGEYDVARFLNSYLSKMSTVIKDYGEIDKLIGDSIMANFESVGKSVNAGIRLLEELQIYNKERFENPERTTIHVRSGIGVHFGPVTMGNIGSPVSRYDYTLIGDSVNVASRIEGLTKRYGVDFLISDTAYDQIIDSIDTENIRSLDIVRVKGRKNPVELYEVFSHEPDQIKQVKHQVQPYLNKAYEHYLNADVETANNIYSKLKKELPKHSSLKERCIDPAIDYLAQRSQWVLTKGLHKEANWNPIHEFKEK